MNGSAVQTVALLAAAAATLVTMVTPVQGKE